MSDYCLLTLTNGCPHPPRVSATRKKSKRRGLSPAPSRNSLEERSALAHQRRRSNRWRWRHFAAGPAHAEAEVVGRQTAEFHRVENIVDTGEGYFVAGGGVAEMDPAIRRFNRE